MTHALIVFGVFLLSLCTLTNGQCGCGDSYRNQRSAEKTNGTWLEGDVIMNRKTNELLFGNLSKFRAGTLVANSKWPNGIVHYHMPWPQYVKDVERALNELSRRTNYCVKFVRLTEEPKTKMDYVQIYNGGGCASHIGRQGGMQLLSLGNGCVQDVVMQHEFMHTLGFYHEQSRYDRDQHLTINWDNIKTSFCSQFRKCTNCQLYSAYNYKSIMQYSGDSFACNDKQTMILRRSPSTKILYNYDLQDSDIYSIKRHYNCA